MAEVRAHGRGLRLAIDVEVDGGISADDGGRRGRCRGQRAGGRQRAVPPSRRPQGRGGRAARWPRRPSPGWPPDRSARGPPGRRPTGSIRDILGAGTDCPDAARSVTDLGLRGPAPGAAPPAYHRPMALTSCVPTYGPAALDALAAAVARRQGGRAAPAGHRGRPVQLRRRGRPPRAGPPRRRGRRGGSSRCTGWPSCSAGPTLARSGRVPVSSPVVATAFRAALAEDPGLFGPVRGPAVDGGGAAPGPPRAAGPRTTCSAIAWPRATPGPRPWWRSTSGVTERLRDPLVRRDRPDGDRRRASSGAATPRWTSVRSSSTCRSRCRARRRGCCSAVAEHAPVTVLAGRAPGAADAPVERLLGRLDLAAAPTVPAGGSGAARPAAEPSRRADGRGGRGRRGPRRPAPRRRAPPRPGIALERIAIVLRAPGAVRPAAGRAPGGRPACPGTG